MRELIQDVAETYPHKAGGEPALLVIDLTPPPVFIGGIQDFDDVSRLKRQLPLGHGHVIPYCLCADHWTSADQL